MRDTDLISDELDDPITPGRLLDRAIGASQLPPRGDRHWVEYFEHFTDAETWRLFALAIDAAKRADDVALTHWIKQTADRYSAAASSGQAPIEP